MIEDEMDDFVIFLKTRGEKIMRKLAGYVALAVVAVLMVSSVAMAWDFRDHVKQSHGGKGDALIFPFYAAINGGWETKLWVINTATDRSVVAKIIFRSQIYSLEVLDFLLYLTPSDVWTGVIRYNPTTGKVELFSDDDSALYSASGTALVWANQNPIQQAFITPSCTSDVNWMGYVEVIASAHSVSNAVFAPATGATPLSLNTPPVNKQALYQAYDQIPNAAMALDGINVLTGYMEFRNNTINQKATLQATVLKDYDATLVGQTKLTVSETTLFGEDRANNSLGEVEAALSKNDLAMYYSDRNLTLHFLTFPTKLTRLGTIANPLCGIASFRGPFFIQRGNLSNGCITYDGTNYDKMEISSKAAGVFSPGGPAATLCGEVNYLTGFAFAEGWARYSFIPPTYATATNFDVQSPLAPYNVAGTFDGAYTGAPVIGTVLNLGSSGDGYTLAPAAFTDGQVRDMIAPLVAPNVGPGTIYYYYQYQDEANTGYLYDADLPLAPVNENLTRPAADGHHPRN